MSSRKKYSDVKRCSFCEKSQYRVDRFIFGPGVYICNECVDACIDILVKENYYLKAPEKIADKNPVAEAKKESAEAKASSGHKHNGSVARTEAAKDKWRPQAVETTELYTKKSYLISSPPSKQWLACFFERWKGRIKGKTLKPEIRFDGNRVIVITRSGDRKSYEKMIAECIRQANQMRGN